MNPSVKDRLGSVVRALNGVVLPALPKEASLAKEQVMLAMGHTQIILAQMDAEPAFLAEEVADLDRMGAEIAAAAQGSAQATRTATALIDLLANTTVALPEQRTALLQNAIDQLLLALTKDGEPASRSAIQIIVLQHGAARAERASRWFAAMGFGIDYSNNRMTDWLTQVGSWGGAEAYWGFDMVVQIDHFFEPGRELRREEP